MNRADAIASLQKLADSLGPVAHGTEWHLFGSVDRNEPDATDIDLMIFCTSDAHADTLRQAMDLESLALPIHLSLMTFQEATEVDAVRVQRSSVIVTLASPALRGAPLPYLDASPLAHHDPLWKEDQCSALPLGQNQYMTKEY